MPSKLLQVLQRFRHEFSVLRFGARGDGVTDDTAAIQAAIDAAEAHVAAADTAAIVSFPPGKYRVSDTLTVQEHTVHLVGDGGYADLWTGFGSAIVPTEDFPNNQYIIRFDWVNKTTSLGGNQMRKLSVVVEQGETLTNVVNGVYWGVCKGLMEDVYIDNLTGTGLGIQGHSSNFKVYETRFRDVSIRRMGVYGLEFIGSSSDLWFDHCQFQGCEGVGGAGMAGFGANNYYMACHWTGNRNHIINTTGATEPVFVACNFETAREHSVYINCDNGGVSRLRFVGCQFNGNSFDTANTYDNIHINRSTGGNTVSGTLTGCTFCMNAGLSRSPRYHIYLGPPGFFFNINNNTFSGAGTSNIFQHDNATRCTINGLGNNLANDPSVGGEWNGFGEEGLRVVKTDTNTIYEYANGAWRGLN